MSAETTFFGRYTLTRRQSNRAFAYVWAFVLIVTGAEAFTPTPSMAIWMLTAVFCIPAVRDRIRYSLPTWAVAGLVLFGITLSHALFTVGL